MKYLAIDRCPEHEQFWAVSVGDDSGGDRVTSSNCCGRWEEVKRFNMDQNDWLGLAQLALEAGREVEG